MSACNELTILFFLQEKSERERSMASFWATPSGSVLVRAILSYLASATVEFDSLRRASFEPPGFLFAIVWFTIYTTCLLACLMDDLDPAVARWWSAAWTGTLVWSACIRQEWYWAACLGLMVTAAAARQALAALLSTHSKVTPPLAQTSLFLLSAWTGAASLLNAAMAAPGSWLDSAAWAAPALGAWLLVVVLTASSGT